MTFVSYAQNFEDVLLWRALHDVEHGRYLDIGAHDPVVDSLSRAFYESGWRGVHVEPTAFYARRLREARPDEIVIEAAVTDAIGPIPFYELGGLSSGCEDIAEHHKKSGHQPRATVVPTVGLDNLLELGDDDIHWLKIDVEGMEADVLRSWRDSRVRPWILVVESTYPNSERPTQHLWINEVLRRGYQEVFFDGLSRFFLHESHVELEDRLNRPANVFDSYQITQQHFSAKQIGEDFSSLRQASEARETQQAALIREQLERIRVATAQVDNQQIAYASLEQVAAAEIKEAQARLQVAETALAERCARLDELSARLHESAAEIGLLNTDLSSERDARVGLEAEILEIAKLADADVVNLSGVGPHQRSVPRGLAYAAVKSRLDLATKELELLREHAERQFSAGHGARGTEINFLNRHISDLQAKITDARDRLGQFEAAYAAARDRSEMAEKDNARLQTLLDKQAQDLDFLETEAAAVNRQLTDSRELIASITRSRGGKVATFFGLLPKRLGDSTSATRAVPIDDLHSPDEIIPTPQHRMEIAVDNVRHVNDLLALNGATFVEALYRTFLKRAPDRQGRDHFVSRLQAGHGKVAVLLAVATSKEGQAIGAPIEGVSELQESQARAGGWFARGDRAFDERLNQLEYTIGEAHNRLFDRLDVIQNSVEQVQAAIGAGVGLRNDIGVPPAGGVNGARQSIKQGISLPASASAPEFIESLRREVQSSSEALSLRRS